VFGDCAINQIPAEQLAEIAISSADSSMALASSLKLQCYPIPLVPPERETRLIKLEQLKLFEKNDPFKIEGPFSMTLPYMAIGQSKTLSSRSSKRAYFPDLNRK
jgi:hypothetical protein